MGHRLLRINESIKEVLSSVITAEGLKDPRVGFVTITGVETTRDLRHAKVYVSVLGKQPERDACMEALEHSKGYLQAKLNAAVHMKRTPQLEFEYDSTLDNALHIEALMRREAEVLGAEPHDIPVPGAADAEGDARDEEVAGEDEAGRGLQHDDEEHDA
jgi:ribosome-binding factor A